MSIFGRTDPQRRKILLRRMALVALVALLVLVLGAGAYAALSHRSGSAAAPADATAGSSSGPAPPRTPRPRTPAAIPSTADVDEAWSVIGNAIVEDDTATFREYANPETYNLVVRPRDINGSQDVLIVSHWDYIGGRKNFSESSDTLPVGSPSPGKCASGPPPYSKPDVKVDYTCPFLSGTPSTPGAPDGSGDGHTIAYFYLTSINGVWTVVGFSPLYG
ncbi:hypothetical protein [Actinomyces israelii]|uniref:hypothetical protein n=1 Tax=Actinomyces israelii TaxID=1659 RepID=UPI0023545F86|nr:hypothetical protein [Actinomyces israelii]